MWRAGFGFKWGVVLTESGLILKNYLPNKYKVAILNDRGERFEAIANWPATIEKLRPGYRIAYTLLDSTQFAKLGEVEITFIPKAASYEGLKFLHQVLELCVIIVPEGQIAPEAAGLLHILASHNSNDWPITRRRLLICCLLSALGFYSEFDEYELIYRVEQVSKIRPADFMEFEIDIHFDRLLISWIANFVSTNVSPRLVALFASIYQN